MLVLEAKLKGKTEQYRVIDDIIRTAQFVKNKALRFWIDSPKEDKINRFSLNKYCAVLAANVEYPWVKKLNSMARQASAERAWIAISRFYGNDQAKKLGKKGFPKFKKFSRSMEYKTSGWSLSPDRKTLTLKDGFAAGSFKLKGTRDLNFYDIKQIKRVRIVKRADGYYAQFCVDAERKERIHYTGSEIGIDVGLSHFLTDSNGEKIDNPRHLRVAEKRLKKSQRRMSRRYKNPNKGVLGARMVKSKALQSKRYHRARVQVALKHLGVRCDSLRVNHGIKSVHNLSWQTVTTQKARTLGRIRVQVPSARLRYDSLPAHTDQTRFLESEAGDRAQSDIRCGMTLALMGSSYGEN
ncbi:MAG TPA: transposase, partial [Coleofasciculaceae cyanobacterium]